MSQFPQLVNFQMTKNSFREKYFETSPYLERGVFAPDLVSLSGLADTLFSMDWASSLINVYKDGLVQKTDYTERYQDGYQVLSRLKPGVLETMLGEGATLVVDRFDQINHIVNRLCSEISSYTGEHCKGNVYMAFGGNGSFGCHWDTHCVFALQLVGKKRWRIYAPTQPNPLVFQKSKYESSDELGDPVMDICLEAGDLLYIPRGWWHDVIPIPGQETVHIAAGLHTAKVHDYVSWLCAEILPKIELFRPSLAGRDETDFLTAEVIEAFKKEMQSKQNITNFNSKMARLGIGKHKLDLEKIETNSKLLKKKDSDEAISIP